MIDLSGLNPPQREAVQTLSGPLLVLAGAGTGKTRVITVRIANLIAHGIQPDRILSVTFTNKAAREMRERALALLGKRKKQRPIVSTFHAYCVRVLREDIDRLGYPKKFAIYDRGDQEAAARTALRDMKVPDKSLSPGELLNRISQWKMAGVGSSEAGDHIDSDFDFLASMAYRKYQNNIRACGAVDFDDLLLLTGQLFRQHADILQKHQSRFDHVQIDEYQDTNGVQFRLIEQLVRPHRNLCVVGDDDQSIYGWRGAEVEHILGFDRHFPGATVVRLENNYRCTDQILSAANRLVRHNRNRHDKTLIAHKPAGSAIRIFKFPDEQSEAESIVQEISYLHRELGVQPRDVAILFRTNEQPRLFETELRKHKVPYMLVGGQSFFDRREIRDVLAYLKAIANPDDEVAMLRIINTPTRGIGASTIEKLLKRAVAGGVSIWKILPAAAAAGDIPAKATTALNAFRDLMNRYRHRMADSPHQLPSICRSLLSEIDYNGEICKQYKEPDQQEVRRNMLEEFVNGLAQYVEGDDEPSLSGFLESTALMDREDEADQKEDAQSNAVRLMTMHSAKGLEFPRVYLVGMEEGLLPHRRSVESGLESQIAEERRLAYVGITRAKDHLTLSRAESRMKWGKRRQSMCSRFLFEIYTDPGSGMNEEEIADDTTVALLDEDSSADLESDGSQYRSEAPPF